MVNRALLTTLAVSALCGALAACDSDDAVAPVQPQEQGLDAREILIRSSLDVRGVRPSADEMAALSGSSAQLDALIDGFVDDPRFAARVRAIFAPALRTRQDTYPSFALDYGLDPLDRWLLHEAVAQEALNIIGHVAVNDAPFSDILTADYTIVDSSLLAVWPLTEVAPQPTGLPEGAVMARYDDGRPAAGVLSTNNFFWRHTSTPDNANRGRTNAISRAFLCEDYLERPIDFPKNVNLADPEAIFEAIKTNPGCQACHATLDPFASHLWGFMYLQEDANTWRTYQPQNEPMWTEATEATPAFFGTPTDGTVTGLASAIASDERFIACTVRRVYESFLGRPAVLADEGQLAAHREAFLTSGLSLKSLVRSVLGDPAYRGREVQSVYGATPEPVRMKLTSPELLSSALSDLTGYRMTYYLREATSVDFALRALAGGSERGAATSASLGHALVHRRLAEASASSLVAADVATQSSRIGRLLARVDLSQAPSNATLVALVREIRSLELTETSPEIARLSALWSQVATAVDAKEAWSAVLTALLSDPDVAIY